MQEKWIDIALLGSDQWCHPIWTAINQAVAEGRTTNPSREFNELCLNLMLRRSLLPRISGHINKGVRSLGVAVSKSGESHISTPSKQGNALVWDQESLLDLVLNIDSLLFELQSCVDLGDTLLTLAYKETGNTSTLKALERPTRRLKESVYSPSRAVSTGSGTIRGSPIDLPQGERGEPRRSE